MTELSRKLEERERARRREYDLADKAYLQNRIDDNARRIEALEVQAIGLTVRLDDLLERLGMAEKQVETIGEDQ